MHFPPVDSTQTLPNELVRYMKVPTFLMLMEGKVFIPSLRTLQLTDPTEARIANRSGPGFYTSHRALLEDDAFKWLYSKGQNYEREFIDTKIRLNADPRRKLYEIWMRELAIRRSIWCWYGERPESMGMWNNYGAHGIAVVSSIENVRAALSLPDDALTSAAKVNYVATDGKDTLLANPLWVNRPYYFKQDAYRYEDEVRFVMACEPVQLAARGGIVRPVNASVLINEVLISPQIHLNEAIAIKKVILRNWDFIEAHQIKISDLLYPNDPETRMALYSLTQDIDQHAALDLPDPLGSRHQEADPDGSIQSLPQLMFEV